MSEQFEAGYVAKSRDVKRHAISQITTAYTFTTVLHQNNGRIFLQYSGSGLKQERFHIPMPILYQKHTMSRIYYAISRSTPLALYLEHCHKAHAFRFPAINTHRLLTAAYAENKKIKRWVLDPQGSWFCLRRESRFFNICCINKDHGSVSIGRPGSA